MKFSECNATQKQVWILVQETANQWIGGLENQMMDSPRGSEDWESAKKALLDEEGVIAHVRSEVFNSPQWKNIDHLHFVTREWTEERIQKRVKKSISITRWYLGI